MFTVVLMAWVIPPLVFGWLVKRNGILRPEPITIGWILRKLLRRRNPYEAGTTHYYHHYLIGKYTYKGIGVERETRKLLQRYDDFSAWIDGYQPADGTAKEVTVLHAGRGQFSLLFALVHPEIEVYSYADTTDDYDLARACEPMPANLHVCGMWKVEGGMMNVINLNDILKS